MSKPAPHAGILCPLHGAVDLDFAQYIQQMRRAHSRWVCPMCGMTSQFDDERYEELNPEPDDLG